MSRGTYVTFNAKEQVLLDGARTLALIQVLPGDDERKPTVDFLHVGDRYQRDDGTEWVIIKAVQVESVDWDPDGAPREGVYTYYWKYEATLTPAR